MAFGAFKLDPPPAADRVVAQLTQLAATFHFSAAELIAQHQDFQRFAFIQHKHSGSMDNFECWRASVQKVCARKDRVVEHPCSTLMSLLARLGAFRGRLSVGFVDVCSVPRKRA
jgi:hypothetical protein